jgi:hypothetical protein
MSRMTPEIQRAPDTACCWLSNRFETTPDRSAGCRRHSPSASSRTRRVLRRVRSSSPEGVQRLRDRASAVGACPRSADCTGPANRASIRYEALKWVRLCERSLARFARSLSASHLKVSGSCHLRQDANSGTQRLKRLEAAVKSGMTTMIGRMDEPLLRGVLWAISIPWM